MTANWVDRLRSYTVPDVRDKWGVRETILYALGVGASLSEIDETQFVFEDGLVALPMMALVLGTPGFWLTNEELGLDWKLILHGEQSMKLLRPLPATGDLIGKTWIGPIADKGPGKPAMLHCTRQLFDPLTKELVAEMQDVCVLRGMGSFGGENLRLTVVDETRPQGAPDKTITLPTSRNQAAIYRLSRDRNPLHVVPAVAAQAGFERPILHGLSTFGVIGRALIHACCDGDATRLTEMRLRFTAPVYPGDIVLTEVWREDETVRFRASVPSRNVVVADYGSARCGGFGSVT
jgi:acyl dehydratase